MKYQEIKDLHGKNTEELKKVLSELKKQIVKTGLNMRAKRLKNTNEVKILRRKMAVINTIVKEKEQKNG